MEQPIATSVTVCTAGMVGILSIVATVGVLWLGLLPAALVVVPAIPLYLVFRGHRKFGYISIVAILFFLSAAAFCSSSGLVRPVMGIAQYAASPLGWVQIIIAISGVPLAFVLPPLPVLPTLRGGTRKLAMSEERLRTLFEDSPIGIAFTGPDHQVVATHTIAWIHDISEQGHYRELVESSPVAIVGQQGGSVIFANAEALRVFGARDSAQILGTSLLSLVHPDSRGEARGHFGEAAGGETAVPRLQLKMYRLDGSLIIVEASSAAHDFNNLLNVVMGHAPLAMLRISDHDIATHSMQKTLEAAQRAAELTRQLLAYAGKERFVATEIDLNHLVSENLMILQASIAKTVALSVELDSSSPRISGDPSQIQQLVMNLIINAGEAMAQHAGCVTLQTGEICLTARSEAYSEYTSIPLPPGKYALVSARDNGDGIERENLRRICDPFFTTKFHGRGLGLAAALGIVRAHHGGLRVTSEVGKGTAFEILFPVVAAAAPKAFGDEPSRRPSTGQRQTILVIDDEPDVLGFVSDVLRSAQYEVIATHNPKEGTRLFRERRESIRLVILDYSVSETDGRSLLQELRSIDDRTRVLLTSGYTEIDLRTTDGDWIPAGFIQKPYTPSELLSAVSKALAEGGSAVSLRPASNQSSDGSPGGRR